MHAPAAEPVFAVQVLGAADIGPMRALLAMFGRAFEDAGSYCAQQPDDAYLADLLGSRQFFAVAALSGSQVIGGLAGYVLPKFERARTELYIYDLAVETRWRRRGVLGVREEVLHFDVAPRPRP